MKPHKISTQSENQWKNVNKNCLNELKSHKIFYKKSPTKDFIRRTLPSALFANLNPEKRKLARATMVGIAKVWPKNRKPLFYFQEGKVLFVVINVIFG